MNAATLSLLDEMVKQQQEKVLALARTLVPDIGAEEIRNPHDFPALRASDVFNYEDGILAGLLSARMAIAAHHHASQGTRGQINSGHS